MRRRRIFAAWTIRVRVFWLSHSGNPARVRNAAIRRAQGRYHAFLDSDDVWDPRKLEVQLRALRAAPACRWSYTALAQIDPDGRPMADEGPPRILYGGNIIEPLLTLAVSVATPAVMAERSLVDEVGGYDEGQLFAEDYDLWLRLAMRSDVAVVDERLVAVRSAGGPHYSLDRIGAYRGWVRHYAKMARCLPEPTLRALARRREAENVLILAGLFLERGDMGTVWRTVHSAHWYCWTDAGWWWSAAKLVGQAMLPPAWRSAYRRARRRRP